MSLSMVFGRAELAIVVSGCALLVSIASFCFAVYVGLRDRAKVRASSNFLPWWEGTPAHVRIKVMNHGRRPVVLRMWVGADRKREWVGHFLDQDNGGLTLTENQRYEFVLHKSDLDETTPDSEVVISDVWLLDTLDRQYVVKGSKANIAKLRAS